MFWKFSSTSPIDSLLTKEDVTLQEVLDFEDIINECRSQNKALLDFLLKPENIQQLVDLTTTEPSIELDEATRFKFPNIASELLTCNVPAINERLAGDNTLLEKLYTFLESEQPLNPLLASYFSKILGALIAKRTEQNWLSYQLTCLQVLDFLKARDTFLPLLLKNLRTSAIMDFMLKLMTQVEGVEMRQNILNWLDSQRIIQRLIELLNPKIAEERYENVAQLLCDFIRVSRDAIRNSTERIDPDPLLNTLQSYETICLILNQIFDGERSDRSIVSGIEIILILLDDTQCNHPVFGHLYNPDINDDAVDIEQKQKITYNITEAICTRIKDFHNLLLCPPKMLPILTTVGQLDPPLGIARLLVIKLLAQLIPSKHERLYKEIMSLGTFSTILDLFFNYPWNNFLHTQVERCIVNAFKANATIEESKEDVESSTQALAKHLLGNCNLIERILTAWQDNDKEQSENPGGLRRGYMGHLINMLNEMLELFGTTTIGQDLKDMKPEVAAKLDTFKDTVLLSVNNEQQSLLAGVHPNNALDDNDDFGDMPFPSTNSYQNAFNQYQIDNISANYVDVYSGLNDDAFNDGDESLQAIEDLPKVNFEMSEDQMEEKESVFKQVCEQHINTLFENANQTFEEKDYTCTDKSSYSLDNNSNSDDESPTEEENTNMDPWVTEKIDPWNTPDAPSGATPHFEWADFSSVNFRNCSPIKTTEELLPPLSKPQENQGNVVDNVATATTAAATAAGGDFCTIGQPKVVESCKNQEETLQTIALSKPDDSVVTKTQTEAGTEKPSSENDQKLGHA